ncbi:tRNA(Phe) 7-((3-amino-3-carboxypropyl)-4-demethylwyosine(37)-N(4))-methyltransferase [Archaeoglobus profundus]|uniref:tRNA(Phe) 7-((3-amino-3-carboxypropyl)-4-demethylwyosine(37)-N(4))-methyltransferase n=1 Tax=Archaeoglobus profundus (strain DSM 5631 / JCM 9629 / NBRC 100127 / Av18) TaxID=572546 RepID=D2RFS8_ARCPA|nr:hypothetical protein [Archaeoglobus profundus]ADB57153.1 Protein of unknown function DUF207 [Archaeoglobus profundus DSM 5631]
MNWNEFKRSKLERLEKAKERKEVDEDIIPLLDLINSLDCFVTTSSCSGRIVVLDVPKIGDKLNAKFLDKWHQPIDWKEIVKALEGSIRTAWLISDPPIIHVACRDLECAKALMKIANDSGFRRCGLISLTRLVVEITSFERLEAPLAVDGRIVVSEEYIRLLADFANEKLLRGKEKLERFKAKLLDHRSFLQAL